MFLGVFATIGGLLTFGIGHIVRLPQIQPRKADEVTNESSEWKFVPVEIYLLDSRSYYVSVSYGDFIPSTIHPSVLI
jgi:hypothetical protein